MQSIIDVAKGWLQWAIDWKPHWIVQGMVVVFLVWFLMRLGGWVAKKIAATMRRSYESFSAEFERQKEEKQEGKISRTKAANQVVAAIKGKTWLSQLAKDADDLFVERGGSSKPRVAKDRVRRALETAAEFGLVKLTTPQDTMVELVKK